MKNIIREDMKNDLKVFLSKSNELYDLLNGKNECNTTELHWMRALEKLTRKVQEKVK